MTRRRIKQGDVYALPVRGCEWMLQVVGRYDRARSWVVRVIDSRPPETLEDEVKLLIATLTETYSVIITRLELDESEGLVFFLGNAPVPEKYKDGVPLFKSNTALMPGDSGRKDPTRWWLSDGTKSWFVGELEKKYRSLPNKTIIPTSVLIDHIDRGWDPNWEFNESADSPFSYPAIPGDQALAERKASFFLFFSRKEDAVDAATAERRELPWMASDISKDAQIDEPAVWTLVLSSAPERVSDLAEVEETLSQIAANHHGEYDGNQIPI